MFSPLRSVALCCLTAAFPVVISVDAAFAQDRAERCNRPGPCKQVNETLVLDPNAETGKDPGTVTVFSKNPGVAAPNPNVAAPDPNRSKPPATGGDTIITQPIKVPSPVPSTPPAVTPPPKVVNAAPPATQPRPPAVVTRPPATQPVLTPGTGPGLVLRTPPVGAPNPPLTDRVPTRTKAPVEPTPSIDAKPLTEMPYITFSPATPDENYEVSLVDNMRGTGRLRVMTDYGPVFCSGFVFGPSVVATSWACVPGVLEDSRAYATKIDEIQIVFDHIFPDQRLWTARGYELVLDTELSSRETGLAILHIADGETTFPADRIQRVGQALPDPRAPLFMLSYPRGGTMALQHCGAQDTDPAYLPEKTFEHSCLSESGDLGAPIFDATTGAVVGMHLSHELSTGRRFATPMLDLANWIGTQQ
ncbi:trypsin-like peptidase domain-containing protein [Maliponia aquimaris]|uniref:Trypsin n=1 Tax=Maliponia aquimaris TaxID=1673631 RepID=A0A238KRA8_9RHOB|nr:trypsin-like peptidase domain-containing protein [Maliponia aquimaris]SMX45315.1 hypothetical protein MAA8898_03191 [Maliponia aquimaris]